MALEYVDKEKNETLIGYSLIDWKKLTLALWVLIAMLAFLIGFALFIFIYIDSHNILSNIVAHCVC